MDDARAILTDPSPGDLQLLEDRLYDFNAATIGIDDGRWLTILVRDDGGTIVAGDEAGRGPLAVCPMGGGHVSRVRRYGRSAG